MTELEIIDLDDGLLVRTKRTPSLAEGLVSATATGGFAAIAASFFIEKPPLIALAVLTASVAFFYTRRAQRFELRITGKSWG